MHQCTNELKVHNIALLGHGMATALEHSGGTPTTQICAKQILLVAVGAFANPRTRATYGRCILLGATKCVHGQSQHLGLHCRFLTSFLIRVPSLPHTQKVGQVLKDLFEPLPKMSLRRKGFRAPRAQELGLMQGWMKFSFKF